MENRTASSAARDTRSTRLSPELWWTHRNGPCPVPVRTVIADRQAASASMGPEGNGYLAASLGAAPFDFTEHMRWLCLDIVSRCECFHHIDMDRVLLHVVRSRSGLKHGLLAKITPMRFRQGQILKPRRGRLWQVQRYFVNDVEMLYLLGFSLPRFLNLSFEQKLITVFHELWHIAPEFNGDLRRHKGRYCVHTHSRQGYDEHMAQLARQYVNHGAQPERLAFLRLNFDQLRRQCMRIIGQVVPTPRLIATNVDGMDERLIGTARE